MKVGTRENWEAASTERHDAGRYTAPLPAKNPEYIPASEGNLPRPRRFALPALGLGIVLLGGTFAGAAMILRGNPTATPVAAPPVATSAPATGAIDAPPPRSDLAQEASKRAVCAAFVDVEQGITPIYPLSPGRVKKIHVRENQKVKAGTVLFQLDDTLAKAVLDEANADVAAALQQLDQAKRLGPQHEEQLKGQKAALDARRAEMAGAQAKLRTAKKARDNGLMSVDEYLSAEKGVEAINSTIEIELAKLRGLESANPKTAELLATNDLAARRARLERAQFGFDECYIKAPFDGDVLRLFISEGESLGPNPRHPAEVEQEFARRLKLGQTAIIQDDTALTNDTWKGKVARISGWYAQRRSILLDPMQFNDVRTVECIIEVEANDKLPALKIGQKLRVTLLPQ
jgi:multidrug resistance efflux pump